jgi:hypothetical protein
MGDLLQFKPRKSGRPRLSLPVVHSDSLCDCGQPKPPLARACTICSWFDPTIFDRLDRAIRAGGCKARRAEYLIENGKEELFKQEFRR